MSPSSSERANDIAISGREDFVFNIIEVESLRASSSFEAAFNFDISSRRNSASISGYLKNAFTASSSAAKTFLSSPLFCKASINILHVFAFLLSSDKALRADFSADG